MGNTDKDKNRDPLPEEFASEDEAGDFWDTHSIADHEEYLEPVDADVDLRARHFEIEIDERTFMALSARAKVAHRSVKDLVTQILTNALATA